MFRYRTLLCGRKASVAGTKGLMSDVNLSNKKQRIAARVSSGTKNRECEQKCNRPPVFVLQY